MSISEILRDWSAALVTAIASAIVGAALWVVRTILTDSKRLSLLEQRQDLQHKETVAAIEASRAEIRALEATTGQVSTTQAKIADILDRMERQGGET